MSLEELEELYEGMIGQSELPPLPVAYREPELLCLLSPILSVSDHSDNSDMSPITPMSNCSISDKGESDTDINVSIFSSGSDNDEKPKFIKPLSDVFPVQNDLCHFVCQLNHRPMQRQFEWCLNNERVDATRATTLGVTLIDHDQHACLIIAKATQFHAGQWLCQIGHAHTSANLTIQPGEK